MARNSNTVFASNVSNYPLYHEKQYMAYHQNTVPQVIGTMPGQQQYYRAATPIQQSIPVQNYRVSATSPIRVSQSVLQQPQLLNAQRGSVYLNPVPNTRVSYDHNTSIVGTVYPQTNQSVVRKMMPVTQYVPVDVIETTPMVAVAPPPQQVIAVAPPPQQVMYVVAPAHQRVIIDEPEIYEKRQIKYTPPATNKVVKVQKIVVQEPKRQEYRDPMVLTVQKSFDGASVRSSRVAPPPAKVQETKTPCSTWLLVLLGLLGLIGLILAIVLSQNSKSSTTVQSSEVKIAEPHRVSASANLTIASKVTPTQQIGNGAIKGQTLVSSPTPVLVPGTNTATARTFIPNPTDISVAQPAVVNTKTTVLSGVQPQTTAPIYVSTNQIGFSTTTTNTNTQPISVQPVLTPGTSVNTTNASTVQPQSVQPSTVPASTTQPTTQLTTQPSTVQPSTSQPATVQPAVVDWIPAFSGPTSSSSSTNAPKAITPTTVSPQTSTTPSTTPTSSNSIQPQTINPTVVPSSSNTNTPATTTTTTTTTSITPKASHFLSLRHHL